MIAQWKYPVISEINAQKYLHALESGDALPLDKLTQFSGIGDVIDVSPLDELAAYLNEVRVSGSYPRSMGHKSHQGGRFEAAVVVETHRVFSGYPMAILADRRFWIWASLAKFSEIIEWRFGADDGPAKAENYGVTKRGVEGLLYRLWLRGEIGTDPASGSQHLVSVGTQDLWRSHIIRQNYANAGELARGILRLQDHSLGVTPLDSDEVRELAKLLKRMNSNVFLSLCSRNEVERLLLELIPAAKAAAKNAATKKAATKSKKRS